MKPTPLLLRAAVVGDLGCQSLPVFRPSAQVAGLGLLASFPVRLGPEDCVYNLQFKPFTLSYRTWCVLSVRIHKS